MRLPHRRNEHAHVFTRRRILFRQISRDRREICLRLRDAHARIQPPHDVHECRITLFDALARQHLRLHHHRHEILRVDPHDRPKKLPRRHSDDRERMPVQMDDFAHDVRIGPEPSRPQPIAQHDVRIGIQRLVRLLVKCVSECSAHAEHVKVILCRDNSPHALGRLRIPQAHVHARKLESNHVRENVILRAKILPIGIRAGVVFAARHNGFDSN